MIVIEGSMRFIDENRRNEVGRGGSQFLEDLEKVQRSGMRIW